MDKKPLITIVTVTYNLIKAGRRDFIIQNIESVHNQTYSNVEHIIVDGASQDGTLELLKPYEDKGWIKIYSEKDSGIYDAMNKGINHAKGNYINFLNSDDFFHAETGLEIVANKIDETDADYLYSDCLYIKNGDQVHWVFNNRPHMAFFGIPFSHQTLFVKKSKMLALNGFDMQYKSASDYDFVLRMITGKATGADCNCNFVSYRCDTGESAVNNEYSAEEVIAILKKNYKKLFGLSFDRDTIYHIYIDQIIPCKLLEAVILFFTKRKQKMFSALLKNSFLKENNVYKLKGDTVLEKKASNVVSHYLFGFLLFLKIKKKTNKTTAYLFGFLPVLKIKKKTNKVKYYLFGFLPLLKVKNK